MDPEVDRVLQSFTGAARDAFGDDLRSVILFGSAAEDRLRPVSDVNLLLVLRTFDPARGEKLRDELRLARAAIDLRPMFLLESELPAARELFAVKFGDVARRHRVLSGDDPFASDATPRAARISALRRALLNLTLRLRERLLSVSDDAHGLVLAESAGAARAAAAEWLALRDGTAPPPKEALLRAATELAGPGFALSLETLSPLREGRDIPPDQARAAVLALSTVLAKLSRAAQAMTP